MKTKETKNIYDYAAISFASCGVIVAIIGVLNLIGVGT